jgi:acetyl esterase/lipase
MAPEVLESIKKGGAGTTPAMIKALQSGDYSELRKRPAPNDDITTCDIKQWEFAINREGYDIMVTACCRKDCADTIKPAVIYLHGGGWCTGSRNNVQNPCRLLAQFSGALVLNVEYRLAPEYKYPVAHDDCFEVIRYLYDNADELRADRNKIIISGDSAGGNLAAACSRRDRNLKTNMISRQVLIYPAVAHVIPQHLEDYHFSLDDYQYDDSQAAWIVPSIKALSNSMALQRFIYVKDRTEALLADASPLLDDDFSGLPDTMIICAEYDFLTQQCKTYAKRLAKAGAKIEFITYRGMNHGFMTRVGRYPQSEDLMKEATRYISPDD